MSDTLQIFGKTFSNATGIVATDNTDTERTFIRPIGTMTIDKNGTYDVSEYASAEVSVSGGGDEPIPEDGKTRIWIHIAEGTPDNRLTFYLRFTASEANNTTVDWGDGVSETLGSTTATNYSHKYSQGGDYVITMTVNSGTISFEGASGINMFGSTGNSNIYNQSRPYKIIFGINCTVGVRAFYLCYGLKQIVLPNNITTIEERAFFNCRDVGKITIPNSVKTIGYAAFNSMTALNDITIPDSVTNIEGYTFQSSMGLMSAIISKNITQIPEGMFYDCTGLCEVHIRATTPPTLANTNAFTHIPSDCIIYVPQGCLSAYQQATNWSTYASHMQEEPT